MGVCSFSHPYPKRPMIPAKVVIGHTEPTLTGVKRLLLGKRQGFAGFSTIEMSVSAMLSFDKRRVDTVRRGGGS